MAGNQLPRQRRPATLASSPPTFKTALAMSAGGHKNPVRELLQFRWFVTPWPPEELPSSELDGAQMRVEALSLLLLHMLILAATLFLEP